MALLFTQGGAYIGQLTAKGQYQSYELGKKLREVYVEELGLLSSSYEFGEL